MRKESGNMTIIEQLAGGESGPVLVADFEPFSPESRLGELLRAMKAGRPVYQIDPVSVLAGERLYRSLPDLAVGYADAFLSAGPVGGPVFVVGHCSAAGLSLRITELLAKSRAVTAILLEPTWPDEQQLAEVFAEFQANLGATVQPCPGTEGDPVSAVLRMTEILRAQLSAMAASRGLDASADVFGELLSRYRAWLAFMLACGNDVPVTLARGAATVKILTSAPAGMVVPGLAPGCYEIGPISGPSNGSSPTANLAEIALAEIRARC
jgi:hypothetical protein